MIGVHSKGVRCFYANSRQIVVKLLRFCWHSVGEFKGFEIDLFKFEIRI